MTGFKKAATPSAAKPIRCVEQYIDNGYMVRLGANSWSSTLALCPLNVDVSVTAGWWTKSDFVINELNINSIISSPAHDEVISLSTGTYTVRGYAYTGEDCCFAHLLFACVTSTSWVYRSQPHRVYGICILRQLERLQAVVVS